MTKKPSNPFIAAITDTAQKHRNRPFCTTGLSTDSGDELNPNTGTSEPSMSCANRDIDPLVRCAATAL